MGSSSSTAADACLSIDGVDVRQARIDEIPEVAHVLSAAAQWLEDHQMWNDWPIPYPETYLAKYVQLGTTYLAQQIGSSRVIGTFDLKWSDPRYWGPHSSDAGYIHRLAIRPDRMGQGLGLKLLDWAQERVAKSGRDTLRLDCAIENERLCKYYERAGFLLVGCYKGSSEYRAALYERRTA